MSCHETDPGLVRGAVATAPPSGRVLLVGAPNVGKSTLFNALTGARQRTVNAPGTTVELATGTWHVVGTGQSVSTGQSASTGQSVSTGTARATTRSRTLVDLPGTYSLLARSADEQVTADAVLELARTPGSGVAVVVLDASALTRSLYLLAQVARTGAPVVVGLTMLDVVVPDSPTGAAPPEVLADVLADILGVPVVPLSCRDRSPRGLGALGEAVDAVTANPRPVRDLPLPSCCAETDVTDLATDLAQAELTFAWVERVAAEVAARLGVATDAQESVDAPPGPATSSFSDRVDGILLHPWAGIPIFLAVVWLLFELTTALAAPLVNLIDGIVHGPVAEAVTWALGTVGLDGGWLHGLLVDGLLAGVGTVLTFLPVMAVMFLALGVLEDSGYLARAAFVADRAMRSLGLDGRALLPLVVGFGCNLPALAATRTLPNARHRLLTGLLIPLTSCSARLTVYVLLAGAFFPRYAGTAIFLMYVASVALVLGGGLLLRRTAFRDVRPEPLVLVLPAYQRPRLRPLALTVRSRVGAFVAGAGKIIVATMLVVWVLMAIPVAGQHAVGDVPVADSAYGRVASAITPILSPAGFGNDHASAALITGFVAKEVVVGSFAQSYAVAEPGDAARAGSLGDRLRESFATSSGGHGAAAAAAFLVFVLAYTPCVATLAEQRRLFGWRPTLGAVSAQLVTAWLLAVLVFQIGSRL